MCFRKSVPGNKLETRVSLRKYKCENVIERDDAKGSLHFTLELRCVKLIDFSVKTFSPRLHFSFHSAPTNYPMDSIQQKEFSVILGRWSHISSASIFSVRSDFTPLCSWFIQYPWAWIYTCRKQYDRSPFSLLFVRFQPAASSRRDRSSSLFGL